MAMFSLPFQSGMVNGVTILEIPTATIDGEQYDMLIAAIENVFPDLSESDINGAIDDMLRQSTARFVSNNMKVYRPKRRTQQQTDLDDVTNRYNNSGFDVDNLGSESRYNGDEE